MLSPSNGERPSSTACRSAAATSPESPSDAAPFPDPVAALLASYVVLVDRVEGAAEVVALRAGSRARRSRAPQATARRKALSARRRRIDTASALSPVSSAISDSLHPSTRAAHTSSAADWRMRPVATAHLTKSRAYTPARSSSDMDGRLGTSQRTSSRLRLRASARRPRPGDLARPADDHSVRPVAWRPAESAQRFPSG